MNEQREGGKRKGGGRKLETSVNQGGLPANTHAAKRRKASGGGGGLLDVAWGKSKAGETITVSAPGATQEEELTLTLHRRELDGYNYGSRILVFAPFGETGKRLVLPDRSYLKVVEPMLRYMYSPTPYFIDQLFLRKKLPDLIATVRCANYLAMDDGFFDALYRKAASYRNKLTDGACRDAGFSFPAEGLNFLHLPLKHAVCWVVALGLEPAAAKANLERWIACDPTVTHARAVEFLGEQVASWRTVLEAEKTKAAKLASAANALALGMQRSRNEERWGQLAARIDAWARLIEVMTGV